MPKVKGKLTAAQLQFCHFKAAGKTDVEAYKLAYPASNNPCSGACRLMALPYITDYIRELEDRQLAAAARAMAKDSDDIELAASFADGTKVLKYWMSVMDSDAESTKDRLKASEYLGKYAHLLDDKVKVESDNNINVKIEVV